METTTASIVNQIRQNLRDRYKSGFPILKELIQNADDAFAHRMDILLLPGISECHHPLLKDPALVVINDGNFSEQDAQAINNLGVSSKSNNNNAVGRFGLGMKSVFHLCEAFFFFANTNEKLYFVNPRGNKDQNGIETDPMYPEWNDCLPEDREILLDALKKTLSSEQFFCVWIPLRKREHCNRRLPLISEFPGEDKENWQNILSPKGDLSVPLQVELARLLPQLRSVQDLYYWVISELQKPEISFRVYLESKSERFAFPGLALVPNQSHPFVGRIRVQQAEESNYSLTYSGQELLVENNGFEELKKSPHWPQYYKNDRLTGKEYEEPDNAQPHSAVVFTKIQDKKNSTKFDVRKAVFLPLEQGGERQPCGGNYSYTLTLHGWFFIDAGRVEVDGWKATVSQFPDNADQLARTWNRHLAQQGTLRLVVPALERAVHDFGLYPVETFQLTESLYKSKFFEDFRDDLCKESQWVFRYAGKESKWMLLPSTKTVFLIPGPPEKDGERPLSVFPGLKDPGIIVTLSNFPRLTANLTQPMWNEDTLSSLLESVPIVNVFSQQGWLEYLIQFLSKEFAGPSITSIQENSLLCYRLLRMARTAFAEVDLQKLSESKTNVSSFCSLIPPEKRFSLNIKIEDLRKEEYRFILRQFFHTSCSVLVYPSEFDDSSGGKVRSLPTEDAVKLLNLLSDLGMTSDIPGILEARNDLALQIIQSVQNPKCLQQQCGNKKLFKGQDYFHEKVTETSFSWSDLISLSDSHCLFRYSSDGSDGLLRHLLKALPQTHFVLIRNDLAKGLGIEIVDCDTLACVRILQTRPFLGDPEKRTELLDVLLRELDLNREINQTAVRYLLHADATHYEKRDWLFSQKRQGDVWQKVGEVILLSQNEIYRFLSIELSESMNPRQKVELIVRDFSADSIAILLHHLPEETKRSLDFAFLTQEERFTILRTLDDIALLRSLPIHETQNRLLVTIHQNTYLESGYQLSESLAILAVLLRGPLDPLIKAAYTRMGVTPLSVSGAVRLALNQSDPQKYWGDILNALGAPDAKNIEPEILSLLQNTLWIPTKLTGRIVSPIQVLHVNGIEEEISHLLGELGYPFVSVLELDDRLRNHKSFSDLEKIVFLKPKLALESLSKQLATRTEFLIGKLDPVRMNERIFETWIELFSHDKGLAIMPVVDLLQAIRKIYPTDALEFSKTLCDLISKERYQAALLFIAKAHEEAISDEKSSILIIFNMYLRAIAESEVLRSLMIPCIRLLNRNGKWKNTSELCYGLLNIDDGDLVDEEQAKALQLNSHQQVGQIGSQNKVDDETGYAKDSNESARRILGYFDEWEQYFIGDSLEILGGFISLLGDQPALRRRAEKYLGKRSIIETREILKWQNDAPTWRRNQSPHDRLEKQFFWVKIEPVETNRVQVVSLAGLPFQANLVSHAHLEHLLLDNAPFYPYGQLTGEFFDYLCLRQVQLDKFTPTQLSRLLRETARKLLLKIYYQDINNFDEFWDTLERSDQLDLEIAQESIVAQSFTYFPMLNLATDKTFRPLIRDWEKINDRQIQAELNQRRWGISLTFKAEEERYTLRSQLKELLNSNGPSGIEVRQKLLDAVRSKIGRAYQYKIRSILFELFQNADDAVVELEGLIKEDSARHTHHSENEHHEDKDVLNQDNRRAVIMWNDDAVFFAHWGRAINQIYPSDGRIYGYDQDLVKMLVMQRSDKVLVNDDTPVTLTGKFGLGFKSIFLITSQPKVISGRLKFQIEGAIYPKELSQYDQQKLSQKLEAWSIDGGRHGTILEIPIDKNITPMISMSEIIGDFQGLVPILSVFSRKINHIELRNMGQDPIIVEWKPDWLDGCENWFVGDLHQIGTGNLKYSGLLWQKDDYSFLVGMNKNGFQPFDSSLPKIWVTAPTEGGQPYGFIINGPFDLDVGRAQLARSSQRNLTVADDFGNYLGKALITLYNHSQENWRELCQSLKLAEGMTPNQFWESFWRATSATFCDAEPGDAHQIVQQTLGGEMNGIGLLIREADVIPTGLQGDYANLTRLSNIHFALTERLETDNIFQIVGDWSSFRKKILPGEVVSCEVRKVLTSLLTCPPDIQIITLIQCIDWVLHNSDRVTPEEAETLGKLIIPKFFTTLNSSEQEELRKYFGNFRFQGKDKGFRPVREMVTDRADMSEQNERDEKLRAAFAPISLILSDEYSDNGVLFFRVTRERLLATTEKMAQWALGANSNSNRVAVLRYIYEGIQGKGVAEEIRSESGRPAFEKSWIASLNHEHPLLSGFSFDQRSVILGYLQLNETEYPEVDETLLPDPKDILEVVYDWWQSNSTKLLPEFEKRIYPYGTQLTLSSDIEDLNQQEYRSGWMTLFLLGSFYTIGRLHPEAYRNFLQDCYQRGWFDTFLNPDSTGGDWIDVLDEYLERITDNSEEKYQFLFVRQFVNIYQLSRHLENYTEVFLSINSSNNPFVLETFTNPNDSEIFSGSGLPQIPHINKLLGSGVCFVMRELVRNRIIKSKYAYQHCYAPVHGVAELFEEMGISNDYPGEKIDSTHIYRFLKKHLGERATFEMAFDIPFVFIADQGRSLRSFLDEIGYSRREKKEAKR